MPPAGHGKEHVHLCDVYLMCFIHSVSHSHIRATVAFTVLMG